MLMMVVVMVEDSKGSISCISWTRKSYPRHGYCCGCGRESQILLEFNLHGSGCSSSSSSLMNRSLVVVVVLVGELLHGKSLIIFETVVHGCSLGKPIFPLLLLRKLHPPTRVWVKAASLLVHFLYKNPIFATHLILSFSFLLFCPDAPHFFSTNRPESFFSCHASSYSCARGRNVWSVSSITLAAVIGSGILPLAWAMAQLGWISGPLVLLFFFSVTVSTSFLISECYHESVEPTLGFQGAVRKILGEGHALMYRIVHGLNLFGMTIGDIIASSLSVMTLMKFHCFHVDHGKDGCHMNINTFMIAIGVFQVFLSQIPALDKQWQLLFVEPFLFFIYSTFLTALGIFKIAETGEFRGSLTGIIIGTVTLFQKISRIFLAVADIAFAFRAYPNTIFEVQDKVDESPPLGLKKMKKAIMISSAFMTSLYLLCSCLSYAAFGDHSTPRDLLVDFGFGFNSLYNWLLVTANVALVIQCVGAYQVHSRVLSDMIEDALTDRFPTLITREIKIPGFRPYELNLFRLVWRTIFSVTTTLISMLLPFFNDVVGLIGALEFWPLSVYLPVQMYIVQKRITKWSTKWILLQILSFLCFIITIAGAVGSIAGFVLDL